MSRVATPTEIRAELGLRHPPFPLNAFRSHFGVIFVEEKNVRSGGVTIWRPDRITVSLPPGGSEERKREDGSHEIGHVANGDVGPHRVVLYRRGRGRSAVLNPQIEDRATDWGVDALVGEGPLRLAVRHEEVKSVEELAHKFFVTRNFINRAAFRYGLASEVLRDPGRYTRYLESPEWARKRSEILSARQVCERPACGRPAVTVQHRRFDLLGSERSEHVEALCHECHEGIRLGIAAPAPQLTLFGGNSLKSGL